jgi:hypothetical protein
MKIVSESKRGAMLFVLKDRELIVKKGDEVLI